MFLLSLLSNAVLLLTLKLYTDVPLVFFVYTIWISWKLLKKWCKVPMQSVLDLVNELHSNSGKCPIHNDGSILPFFILSTASVV